MTVIDPPDDYKSGRVTNRSGAAVVAAGYTLIIITLTVSAARLYSTIRVNKVFGIDNLFFIIANCMALTQAILTDRSVHAGLGKGYDQLTPEAINTTFKLWYAASILCFVAQGFAKWAVVIQIMKLNANSNRMKLSCRLLLGLIGAWITFSFFAVTFECGLPTPWIFTKEHCFVHGRLFYGIIAGNIFTDIVIATFFLPVIWKLKIERNKRLAIMGIFAARLIIVAISIGHLVLLHLYFSKAIATLEAMIITIFTQLETDLSIIMSALPNLHRFLLDLQTGGLAAYLPEQDYNTTHANTMQDKTQPSNSRDESAKCTSKRSSADNELKLVPADYGQSSTYVSVPENNNQGSFDSAQFGPMLEFKLEEGPEEYPPSRMPLHGIQILRTRESSIEYSK